MNIITKQNFPEKLLEVVPEFKQSYDKYLNDNDGENLIHILMSSFYNFLIENFKNGNKDLTKKIIIFIDKSYNEGDNDVINAVNVSFFENLWHESYGDLNKEEYEEIKAMMPDTSKKGLQAMIEYMEDMAKKSKKY